MNPITLPIRELKPVLTGLGKIIDKQLRASALDCIRIERTRTRQIELAATDLNTYVVARIETPTQGILWRSSFPTRISTTSPRAAAGKTV